MYLCSELQINDVIMVKFNFNKKVINSNRRTNQNVDYGTFACYKFAGIYKITSKTTNKSYIGASKDISARLQKHFSELRHNRHRTKELQNDYNKYGYDDFVFECIEQTNNFLLEKEKNYQINEGIDKLYNEKISGYYMTKECRNAHKNADKSTHKTKEYRDKMSKITANRYGKYSLFGTLIKTYDNFKEILLENPNYKINPIRGCCNGSKNTAYGYVWRYIDNDNNIINDGYKKRRKNI